MCVGVGWVIKCRPLICQPKQQRPLFERYDRKCSLFIFISKVNWFRALKKQNQGTGPNSYSNASFHWIFPVPDVLFLRQTSHYSLTEKEPASSWVFIWIMLASCLLSASLQSFHLLPFSGRRSFLGYWFLHCDWILVIKLRTLQIKFIYIALFTVYMVTKQL